MMEQTDHYVAVYRDGIPAMISFSDLKVGDDLILNSKETVSVSYHDAKQSASCWFIHDNHHNAWFANDCNRICQVDCDDTLLPFFPLMAKFVNEKLKYADMFTARKVLATHGYDETLLRTIGFGFLFDVVGII